MYGFSCRKPTFYNVELLLYLQYVQIDKTYTILSIFLHTNYDTYKSFFYVGSAHTRPLE